MKGEARAKEWSRAKGCAKGVPRCAKGCARVRTRDEEREERSQGEVESDGRECRFKYEAFFTYST